MLSTTNTSDGATAEGRCVGQCERYETAQQRCEAEVDRHWPVIMKRLVAWVIDANVTRIIRRETTVRGDADYILMGLWKIRRSAAGATYIFRLDMKHHQWCRDRGLDRWPELKLLPLGEKRKLGPAWKSLLNTALDELFRQVLATLHIQKEDVKRALMSQWKHHDEHRFMMLFGREADIKSRLLEENMSYWNGEKCSTCGTQYWDSPDLSFNAESEVDCEECKAFYTNIASYVSADFNALKKRFRELHQLNLGAGRTLNQSWSIGARRVKALRAALWRDALDRRAVSLAARIAGDRTHPFHLKDVLRVQTHIQAVERVETERPQWLPMLSLIHPRYWKYSALFSRKHWVRAEGSSSTVDRRSFCPSQVLRSLLCRSSFRFINESSYTGVSIIVQGWSTLAKRLDNTPGRIDQVIGLMRAVSSTTHHRPAAKALGIKAGWLLTYDNLTNNQDVDEVAMPAFVRLGRAWVTHRLEVWEKQGYRAFMLTTARASTELEEACHWCRGIDYRYPDHNMNWEAIRRHTENWHDLIRREGNQSTETYTWSCPIGEIRSKRFIATPLISSEALRAEGSEMHHCVSMYDKLCHQGGYLVFSISAVEPDAKTSNRATLGIDVFNHESRLNQLYSHCNQPVSKEVSVFARRVIDALNIAMKEGAA